MSLSRLSGAQLLVVVALAYLHSPSHSCCKATEPQKAASAPTEFHGHTSQVNHLAFLPDGKTLLSAEANGSVFVWNMADKQGTVIFPEKARILSVSVKGTKLITCTMESSTIRVWDVATSKDAGVISLSGQVDVVAAILSPDESKVFTLDCNRDRQSAPRVRQWDTASGREQQMWASPKPVRQPEFDWGPVVYSTLNLLTDGKTVVVALDFGGIRIYDVQSARDRLLGIHSQQGVVFTLTPDARLLASWRRGTHSPPRIWEVATGKEICQLKRHPGALSALALSPDGHLFATGNQRTGLRDPFGEQAIHLWNAASGDALARFEKIRVDVTALTFTADGTTLAAGLGDGTILIWKLEPGLTYFYPMKTLGTHELEEKWSELFSADAGQAHQAIWALTAFPKESLPFLKSRLRPTVIIEPTQINKWIADLDSDQFALRQAASKELARAWDQTQKPIQEALRKNPTLETRRRLEQILNARSDIPAPESVQSIRAIMALERIGSPDAQAILGTLATGAPGTRETEEAKASLERFKQRAAKVP